MWQILGTNSPFRLPKTGVQPIQATKIVQKWLNDHPEDLHSPADALYFIADLKHFPIRTSNIFRRGIQDCP